MEHISVGDKLGRTRRRKRGEKTCSIRSHCTKQYNNDRGKTRIHNCWTRNWEASLTPSLPQLLVKNLSSFCLGYLPFNRLREHSEVKSKKKFRIKNLKIEGGGEINFEKNRNIFELITEFGISNIVEVITFQFLKQ